MRFNEKNPKSLALVSFFIFLVSSACAGEQEEIKKALSLYGAEAHKIMEDSQRLVEKNIPAVEDYFRNPSEPTKPQKSFFGFRNKRLPEPSHDPAKSCQSCQSQGLEILEKPSRKQEKGKKLPSFKPLSSSSETLVFVSLGLPEAVLKQLALEAAQNKSRLVIRGLVNNSFKETQARLETLNISVEIDPTLFDLFEVKRVPTFVRCKKSSQGEILKEGHDRLEGNVPLSYALEKFQKAGA